MQDSRNEVSVPTRRPWRSPFTYFYTLSWWPLLVLGLAMALLVWWGSWPF